MFLKLNKRLPDGELTAVPLSTLPWWPSRLFWGRPGASSKHQAPANRSSSSFILLPFHRQLDPRATILSSIESLVRTTSFDRNRWLPTSYFKKKQATPESRTFATFLWHWSQFLHIQKKGNRPWPRSSILEHQPSPTRTILVRLSTLGWLIKILSETIELQ